MYAVEYNAGIIGQFFGSIADLTKTDKTDVLGELLSGNRHWKCTKCGLITLRASNGEVKWEYGKSK